MADEPSSPDGALDPDAGEEALADVIDDVVPSHGYRLTRVVGIGGSAGSIQAMRRFFEAMPAQPGMAFVVILHLAPEHDSTLSSVLQTATSMSVEQASDGQKVQPDHVYVIPPGKHLSLLDGHLRLTELPRERGRRMTVDLFFRSLADTHGAHSVAIVLSGLDGDGALGIRRIKERGGLTIAQDLEEAEHPSMPRSAIATSMVDWVLTVDKMPARVLAYHTREQRLALPPEQGAEPTSARAADSDEEAALREMLTFVRARTGRDVSNYKRETIVRRLARRMQVNEVDDLRSYLDYLRLHPGEAGALLQDLLISVTSPSSLREPSADHVSRSKLHLKLMERHGPPSLIINGDQNILHLSPGMRRFLRFPSGEPSANVFRVIHPALRTELRGALFRLTQTGKISSVRGVPVELGEERILADIRVAGAPEIGPGFALLTIDARDASELEALDFGVEDEPVVRQLERELDQLRCSLRELLDQHDASTEELKSSNEELQATNEELRSATEELETGREELQAMNEELSTVNQELKGKVDELGLANSHLHNLMGATAIATVFLDRELRIVRFTPSAVPLFSLIAADVGRPLAHLRHSLAYPELSLDAARVFEQHQPIEREVGEDAGRVFLARLLPYHAPDEHVAGVALTFVDVTELHHAREELQRAQQDLELRVQQRTAQVDQMNDALRAEVSMHEQSEKARQDLQRRLLDAQEQERSRISRELHDEVGQQISALMLAVKTLEGELPAGEMPDKLRDVRGIAEQIGKEIHQLATQLRPVALDELGLARALSGYLDNWSARSGIAVDFFSAGIEDTRLPSVVETTIYRIIQEAMNNVYKHASAKNVSVSVDRRAEQVLAIVEDDGTGFDFEASQASEGTQIGIAGMRERASIAGGSLTVESSRVGGTIVRVQVPLPRSVVSVSA